VRKMVLGERLELSQVSLYGPEPYASTNSANRALLEIGPISYPMVFGMSMIRGLYPRRGTIVRMRLLLALVLCLWCVIAPAPDEVPARTEGQIWIDYENTGSDATGKPERAQFDLVGKIVNGESTAQRVVIEFEVKDPGKKSLVPFFSRAPGTVNKRIVLTGNRAEVVYEMFTRPSAFLSTLRSPPAGVSEEHSGGVSLGRMSYLRFAVEDTSFPSVVVPEPERPTVRVRLFNPSLANTDPREGGGGSAAYKSVSVSLNSLLPSDVVSVAQGIGTTRTKFGIIKPGKKLAPFVALGVSRQGYVLGILDSELMARRPGHPLTLRSIPIEALREATGQREYLAWRESDALALPGEDKERWEALMREAIVGHEKFSNVASQSYAKRGVAELLVEELPAHYLGTQEVVSQVLPILNAADRCRRILGIQGDAFGP